MASQVRNVPYPPGTFSVELNSEERKVVIKTSNKKCALLTPS